MHSGCQPVLFPFLLLTLARSERSQPCSRRSRRGGARRQWRTGSEATTAPVRERIGPSCTARRKTATTAAATTAATTTAITANMELAGGDWLRQVSPARLLPGVRRQFVRLSASAIIVARQQTAQTADACAQTRCPCLSVQVGWVLDGCWMMAYGVWAQAAGWVLDGCCGVGCVDGWMGVVWWRSGWMG